MRDSANNLHFKPAIAPVAALTNLNTPIVSTILDTFGYGSATLALVTGTETDTNVTTVVLLEESNDSGMAGATAVADIDLIGTELLAAFQFDDDNECRKLGYVGSRRYIRATVTPSGNDAGNIFLAGMWVQGHPASAPTPNPPQ
ncbi:hypothetical protein UB31_08620 [Bradyrhizobium sp. LTSP849]|uniref:hypothetical protein n=1 Tax=Bradyrhizobium sp. LTSP849 TaxID=1615890 RepID=UPI0005D2223F|nr:hypothetical protein [Bradyrhizobium sp. LTSP849]KJC53466.1 hypothetical protein UB31_08620 [Bradyrhizobium sp. LTSP849]